MGTLYVCAVFDSAVQAFNRPIFVPAVGVAVRGFTDEVNRNSPDNTLYAHPDDFELHELCTFDEEKGTFDSSMPTRVLCRAKDVKNV